MTGPTVVIGSGIVGTSIAFHLADRGIPTVLVERDVHLQGATSGSFASITAFDELAHDFYLLKVMGIGAWRELEKRLDTDIGLAWPGEIRWSEEPEHGLTLRRQIDRARSRGYPVRPLQAGDLKRHLPEATPGEVLTASYAWEDGIVDATKTVFALRAAFGAAGGELLLGRAAIRLADGLEVTVGDRVLRPDKVVIAAGAETASVMQSLGWEIPMVASPGLLVRTGPTGYSTPETVYACGRDGIPIHLRKLEGGRVLIGERDQSWVVREPSLAHAEALLRQAATFFPSLRSASVERFGIEWRPMPADGMPIVGPAPGMKDLYLAVSHSGVTVAPALGDLVAREVTGEHCPRLGSFRPSRFGERNAQAMIDIEAAFEEAPEAYLG